MRSETLFRNADVVLLYSCYCKARYARQKQMARLCPMRDAAFVLLSIFSF